MYSSYVLTSQQELRIKTLALFCNPELCFFSVVAMHLCYLDQGNKILAISDNFGILNHKFSEWYSFQNFLKIPRVLIVLQFAIHGVS